MAPSVQPAPRSSAPTTLGADCNPGEDIVVAAKVKRRSATTPYTHDARNTRRTTHAVPLAGKAWRQSLHRSLMAASGRHSGPGHEASSAQSSCEPTKPPPQPPRAGTPLGATTTQRMAIRRTRCLAARRLSANNGVTPKVPSSATADGAMSEIQEWRRDRALGSGAAPALFAGARLSRQRGAARQRDAPRGGINVGKVVVVFSIGDNSADAHSSLMQCPERHTPKRKCQNQSFRFSSHKVPYYTPHPKDVLGVPRVPLSGHCIRPRCASAVAV